MGYLETIATPHNLSLWLTGPFGFEDMVVDDFYDSSLKVTAKLALPIILTIVAAYFLPSTVFHVLPLKLKGIAIIADKAFAYVMMWVFANNGLNLLCGAYSAIDKRISKAASSGQVHDLAGDDTGSPQGQVSSKRQRKGGLSKRSMLTKTRDHLNTDTGNAPHCHHDHHDEPLPQEAETSGSGSIPTKEDDPDHDVGYSHEGVGGRARKDPPNQVVSIPPAMHPAYCPATVSQKMLPAQPRKGLGFDSLPPQPQTPNHSNSTD